MNICDQICKKGQLSGFNPEEEIQNFMVRILILTAALHYYKESAL